MYHKKNKPETNKSNNDDLLEHLTFTFEERSPTSLAHVAEVISEQGSSQQCMQSLREADEQQENLLERDETPQFPNEIL